MQVFSLKKYMKNKGLLTFLMAVSLGGLLAVSGCKKPTDEIGSDIGVVDGDINSAFLDTFSIRAFTVREPSVRADRTSLLPFGSYFDPYYGITTSSMYLNFAITTSFSMPAAPVVDSVVLRVRYGTPTYFGDIGKYKGPINVTVYRLLERLTVQPTTAGTVGYKSDQVFNIDNTPVGSATIVPNPYDSVLVGTVREPAHLRVKLNNAFGTQLLTETPWIFNSTADFLDRFRGLYLKVTPAANFGDGGFVYLFPPGSGSRLSIYFHDNGVAREAVCRVTSDGTVWVAHHEHNYGVAVPPFQNMSGPVSGEQNLLIQPLSGTKVKLHLPYIKSFNADKSLGVNKAELVFPVDPSLVGSYAPSEQLLLARYSPATDSLYNLADYVQSAGTNGGAYDAARKEYKFNITLHMQSVLAGLVENDTLVLEMANKTTRGNRVPLYGTQNAAGRVKLRIYYTKLQ